jgi:glycosyltransferase involved in cell wall biosynthesis
MVPAHVEPLVRAVERFAREERLNRALLHGFGLWGGIAVAAARRLTRQGVQATAVVSAYSTYAYEARAKVDGLDPTAGLADHVRFRMLYLWGRLVVDRYERQGYTGAARVLVNYDSIARLLEDAYRVGARCRKIPYSSESAFLDTAAPATPTPPRDGLPAGEPGSAPLVVAVSRHDPRKGVNVLIRALARLRAGAIPFRACLVGGGPLLDENRRLVTRLGLDAHVSVTGFVPDPRAYLRLADVFVLPSLRESSGSVSLIEALHAGLPVVTSSCDGIPEDVIDGRSALLVSPGDVDALATALGRLLRDPGLRQSLARGGREVFARKFSPLAVVEALRAVYGELGLVPSPPGASG